MEKICPYSGKACTQQCARYDQEDRRCVDLSICAALHSIGDNMPYGC